jgi:hypothetical protein
LSEPPLAEHLRFAIFFRQAPSGHDAHDADDACDAHHAHDAVKLIRYQKT